MIFINHSPINMDNAKQVAIVDFSGDFTIDKYILAKGKQFHLYAASCGPYEHQRTERTYLFGARSLDEVKAWLREKAAGHADLEAAFADSMYQPEPHDEGYAPYAALMLEKLGDLGEEA